MMPRLVLVSMVAALGITIPTWPEIQGRMQSIHAWTASRLAELDASTSRYEDPPMMAPPPVRQIRPFTPIDPDDRVVRVVDELNRAAEGVDLPAVALVRRPLHEAESTPAPARMRFCRESAVIPTVDVLECERIKDVLETAQRSIEEAARVASRRSEAVPPHPPCVFSASWTRSADTLTASKPIWDPIEPMEGGAADVAGSLNRLAGGIDEGPANPIQGPPPRPAFTPIDPEASVQLSLADELNRGAEGLALVLVPSSTGDSRQPASTSARDSGTPLGATAGGRPAPPGPAPAVAQAMRLTRDAVHAWMRVMAGPTIVQVSAR